jgi:hypothetical protein
MKSYFALLGAVGQLGWGLVAPVPSPTDTATGEIDLYGITPKPTTLALLHPGLAKRQAGQSLLGYVSQFFPHKEALNANDLRHYLTTHVVM